MGYTCKAERVTKPVYDEITLVGGSGSRVTLFENMPCRIWEIQGAMALQMGETDIMTQNLQISLPWDSEILKKHDEIVITFSPESDDSMLGKRFEVLSSARAGELRATRRYQVTAVERR